MILSMAKIKQLNSEKQKHEEINVEKIKEKKLKKPHEQKKTQRFVVNHKHAIVSTIQKLPESISTRDLFTYNQHRELPQNLARFITNPKQIQLSQIYAVFLLFRCGVMCAPSVHQSSKQDQACRSSSMPKATAFITNIKNMNIW